MEIVFAILILIGAVAAGSSPSTSEVHTEKHAAGDSAQTTVVRNVKATPGPCRFPGGRLIQRDLTVPRASISVVSKVNLKEAGHACADR